MPCNVHSMSPTVTDQYEKDKTSGSAQVKVHQQRLAIVSSQSKSQSPPTAADQCHKKRRVGAHKPKSTNTRVLRVGAVSGGTEKKV